MLSLMNNTFKFHKKKSVFLSSTFTFQLEIFNFYLTKYFTGHHLSNQAYDICFRREKNYCYICYETTSTVSFNLLFCNFFSFNLFYKFLIDAKALSFICFLFLTGILWSQVSSLKKYLKNLTKCSN